MYLTLGEGGGSVMALKANTGELIWRTGDDPASYSSPIIINVDGQKQLICFLENNLIAYNPANGQVLWQQQISKGYDEHSTWPTFDPPYLFCASSFFRDAYTFKLSYKEGKAIKEQLWRNKSMSNDIFSSVIINSYIYGFHIEEAQANPVGKTDGRFKCINLKTGKELWSTQKTGHVNVLAVKNKLVLFTDDGTLIISKAAPTNYMEITRQSLFDNVECWSLPALLMKDFIFTWPLFLFTILIMVLNIRTNTMKRKKKFYLLSRFLLILFILLCFGYYQLCHSLFIISGIGFLVGLIPTAPLAFAILSKSEPDLKILQFWKWAMVFTIYFWISTFFIIWKTG